MNIVPVLNQIGMLAIIMCVGLLLRKIDIFQESVIKGVNKLMMAVSWPALMIYTTQKDYTRETLSTYLVILLGSMALMALLNVVLVRVYRKKNRDLAPILMMLSAMPNCGFFGIPIIEAMYGSEGLLYLSAYIIGFNLVLWSFAMASFTGFSVKNLKGLLNPGIICAAIGITLFLLRIHLPTPLMSTVSQLAALNTPLSMLILGARMDLLRPKMLLDGKLWVSQLLKLIVLPGLVLALLRALGMTGMPLVIFVACTAMPAAISVQMFTERFGGDVYYSAKGTAVSTVLSLATLPLMIWMTGLFA